MEEVLCQISTFLAAGHETTSSALTWCLYALSQDIRVQDHLRAALLCLTTPGDDGLVPEQDDLTERIMRCEYLDWVVREVLRVHAPVTNTMRVCMRDRDEIPLQGPGGLDDDDESRRESGYVDEKGTRRWSIPVRKWDIISVPIQAINKSEAFWGPDAAVFRCVSKNSRRLSLRSFFGRGCAFPCRFGFHLAWTRMAACAEPGWM